MAGKNDNFDALMAMMALKHIIRKLTPKECWRLMDFSDADFHKAEKVNSNDTCCAVMKKRPAKKYYKERRICDDYSKRIGRKAQWESIRR